MVPDRYAEVELFIICHKLSILPVAKLVKQKPRKMNAERFQALNDEVDFLLKADSSERHFIQTGSPI